MDYLEYFRIKEKPFESTFNPQFYYESISHKEASDHLRFLLRHREGFALIYGNKGVGKTTLARLFLSSLDKKVYNAVHIEDPVMDEITFLKEILKGFGILKPSDEERASKKLMFDKLRYFLLDEFEKGKNNLLVIDNAQLLSHELLQFVRILSNFETDKEKILSIVLFAEPEFVERLKEPEHANIAQRITIMYQLTPLRLEEVASYIQYRLIKAGSKGLVGFDSNAVKRIYEFSQGYPATINKLCEDCLEIAFSGSEPTVTEKTVRLALKEKQGVEIEVKKPIVSRRIYITTSLGILVIAAIAALVINWQYLSSISKFRRFQDMVSQKPQAAVSTPGQKPSEKVAKPVAPAPELVPSSFIFADNDEYVLLCEKSSRKLFLYRFVKDKFIPVKSYPCSIGANKKDKQKSGDRATPEGVFFTTKFISKKELPGIYGYGAFVLNYPNFIDKKEGKTGGGIWLNGHHPDKDIERDIRETNGSIIIDNNVLKEIASYIKPSGTPVVVVNQAQTSDIKKQHEIRKELQAFLDEWRKVWESLDTKRHLQFYASDYRGINGIDFKTFKENKEKVKKTKQFIQITLDDVAFFTPPGYEGIIAIARFHQTYHSNNFNDRQTKLLYLRKGISGWIIFGEENL